MLYWEMYQDESITSSYIHEHKNGYDFYLENILLDVGAAILSSIGIVLGFELLCNTLLMKFYVMVTCMTIESSCTSCILCTATSLRLLNVNSVLLLKVSISGMTIEGKIISLIGIVLFELSLFSCLTNELSFVCGWSIKFCCIRSIFSITRRSMNIDLIWYIASLVSSFVIEFSSIWLVSIPWLIACLITFFLRIIISIGWLEKIRIIVTFIQLIPTFLRSFNWNIVCFVKLVISGISIEGDMLGRTVMFV